MIVADGICLSAICACPIASCGALVEITARKCSYIQFTNMEPVYLRFILMGGGVGIICFSCVLIWGHLSMPTVICSNNEVYLWSSSLDSVQQFRSNHEALNSDLNSVIFTSLFNYRFLQTLLPILFEYLQGLFKSKLLELSCCGILGTLPLNATVWQQHSDISCAMYMYRPLNKNPF